MLVARPNRRSALNAFFNTLTPAAQGGVGIGDLCRAGWLVDRGRGWTPAACVFRCTSRVLRWQLLLRALPCCPHGRQVEPQRSDVCYTLSQPSTFLPAIRGYGWRAAGLPTGSPPCRRSLTRGHVDGRLAAAAAGPAALLVVLGPVTPGLHVVVVACRGGLRGRGGGRARGGGGEGTEARQPGLCLASEGTTGQSVQTFALGMAVGRGNGP